MEPLCPEQILHTLTRQRARHQLPLEPRLDVSTRASVPRDLPVAATHRARHFIPWKKNCEQTTLCSQNKLWCLIAIYVLMCRLFAATFVGFGVVWGFFNDKFQHLEDRVALPSTAHTLESSCRLSQQGKGLVGHRVSQQTQGQGRKLLRISHRSA